MIQLEYIVDKDKSLLTLVFDRKVLKYLKAKCDDNLYLLQSEHNANLLTLFKADTGYRVRRVPHRTRYYQILINHRLKYIEEFNYRDCNYFMKNNLIRIKLS